MTSLVAKNNPINSINPHRHSLSSDNPTVEYWKLIKSHAIYNWNVAHLDYKQAIYEVIVECDHKIKRLTGEIQ